MESGFTILLQRIGTWFKHIGYKFRFLKVNKEIFVFSVFLCIAIVFWFSQTFKDHTTVNIEYTLQINNVPKNIIFTSDVPNTINVSVSGRGFAILQYIINNPHKVINIEFNEMSKLGGILTIDNYIWKKALTKELPSGVIYSSVSPSSVDIYYSTGEHRQIPVVFNGKVRTSDQHILCNIELFPQYVDIYAPYPQYDTIKAVYTEQVLYKDVKDTLNFCVALQKIRGVKMIPDSVNVRACVDLFTSKTIKVPIYCENIPQNKILRTFPLMADVTFRVSATMFNNISSDDFIVVVDFNSIKSGDSKCKLVIRDVPEGIYNVKIMPGMVDYVIEQED